MSFCDTGYISRANILLFQARENEAKGGLGIDLSGDQYRLEVYLARKIIARRGAQ
jgi:hypothetical protein